MQKLVGLVRRCADDYGMLQSGDRVAVGVSGGKDSLTLLVLLAALRQYHPSHFDLHAVTVDMGLAGMDFSQVASLCDRLEVPYTRVETQIAPIIFDYRQEKNPCSMCAKMRRGALNQALLDLGCNKVALGHHYFFSLCFMKAASAVSSRSRTWTGPASFRSGPCCTFQRRPSPTLPRKNSCLWCTIPAQRIKIPSGRRSRSWFISSRPNIRT